MDAQSTHQPDRDADMELRLWAYIDGLSTEGTAIESLLAENRTWKEKYAELLAVHELVNAADLEEPSLRFTKNVMEEIGRLQIAPAAKQYINNKIIWGIAAFFITVIVSFLVYGLSQLNWQGGSEGGRRLVDLEGFDPGKLFNNTFVNLFMMVNVVLGLMLLDRYLSMKRKKMRGV